MSAFTVAIFDREGEARTAFHAGEGDGLPRLGEVEMEHLRAGDFVVRGGVGDKSALLAARSEEHTSELQSRENLVCRLLLEKKKNHDRSERVSVAMGHD